LIDTAIELAAEQARKRGLDIHYEVQDICELPCEGPIYDMIVDSYCLQCIVTDADRHRVFSAVRSHLRPEGYYLVSTAMLDREGFSEAQVLDVRTGVIYNRYGDGLINAATGIVYVELQGNPDEFEHATRIAGGWHLPNRRHLKPSQLKAELETSGFRVQYQDSELGGNVICAHA